MKWYNSMQDENKMKPSADELDRWEKVADKIHASRIAEYVTVSQRTWRIIWTGFVVGLARGLGFTIGTAVVITVLYKIIAQIISMNIPYITEALQNFMSMIK